MLYQRQESLELKLPSRVVVVGCGGAGSWASLFCALCGAEDITLIDPDVVETSNLNRTPYKMSDVGRPKVDALADLIMERRRIDVFAINDVFPSLVSVDKDTVLIDATDNIGSQRDVHEVARINGARYIRVGYNGHMVSVSDDPTVVWECDDDPDDDTYGTSSWVGSSSLAGLLGLLYTLGLKDERYSKEVKEI